MEQYAYYLKVGKELGLDGHDLIQFAQQREESEEKKRQDSILRDERQKEREHAREIKELDLRIAEENARANADTVRDNQDNIRSTTAGSLSGIQSPRLPQFKDGQDDLDSYIRRFERFATSAGWLEGNWAVVLSTLLTGKALDVYTIYQ